MPRAIVIALLNDGGKATVGQIEVESGWYEERTRSIFGGEEVSKGRMTERHFSLFVSSRDVDNGLEVQQDAKNLEHLDAKDVGYLDNPKCSCDKCDGGDDVAEMGEMLRMGKCLGIQAIGAVHP